MKEDTYYVNKIGVMAGAGWLAVRMYACIHVYLKTHHLLCQNLT